MDWPPRALGARHGSVPRAAVASAKRTPPAAPCRRASRDDGSGFWPGFVVGGVVCGVLGFVFAPQVSRQAAAAPRGEREGGTWSPPPLAAAARRRAPCRGGSDAPIAACLQISRALLGDDQRLRLPRFLEEEPSPGTHMGYARAPASLQPLPHTLALRPTPPAPAPLAEVTKQNLAEKIAQLNSAIDDVSAQLKSQDPATTGSPLA